MNDQHPATSQNAQPADGNPTLPKTEGTGIGVICTSEAPEAIGPYSQAVTFGNMVLTSGQIALDPRSGTLVEGGIEVQTRQVLSNLRAVLKDADSSLAQALKVTIYLKNMADFPLVNRIYAEEFGAHRPARSTVEVARLPRDAQIEIDVVAIKNDGTP